MLFFVRSGRILKKTTEKLVLSEGLGIVEDAETQN